MSVMVIRHEVSVMPYPSMMDPKHARRNRSTSREMGLAPVVAYRTRPPSFSLILLKTIGFHRYRDIIPPLASFASNAPIFERSAISASAFLTVPDVLMVSRMRS